VRGSIGVFFALLAAGAGCAVWFDAALSWDGAYMFFKALDERTPFIPLERYAHFVLQAPAVLAQQAGVSEVRVLRALFGAAFALVPLTSLALCWWIVRGKRPGLFVWPVLSITLGNLGGAFFLVTEAPIATTFFWPIVLALLVGSVTWLQASALTGAAALVFFAHPTAAPLFAGAGLLALLQGLRGAAGVRPRRWWIVGVACLILAGLRSLRQLTDYEARSFSLPSFARAFHVATWGWPRLSLACTTIAALLVLVHPFLPRRWRNRAMDRALSAAPAVLAFAAGLLMVPWALDERAWAKALNYRFVAHAFSSVFLTVASLEGIVGDRRAGDDPWPARRAAVIAAGVSFVLVFAAQGTAWRALRERFIREVDSMDAPCASMESLRSVGGTPLKHWACPSLAIDLQGRDPNRLVLPPGECERWARTGVVQIAPWDERPPGHGWFRLPR
jgi:hypothetical protein